MDFCGGDTENADFQICNCRNRTEKKVTRQRILSKHLFQSVTFYFISKVRRGVVCDGIKNQQIECHVWGGENILGKRSLYTSGTLQAK